MLTDDIEVALHMFQGCFLFNELLRNDNTSIWPWCTRLVEQGIQLEMTQIRQLAIEIITTLLQRTYPSNTSTSDCSGLVDLLQSNGHHCLAYHTTILVRYNIPTILVRYNIPTILVRYNIPTILVRYNIPTILVRYNIPTILVRYLIIYLQY